MNNTLAIWKKELRIYFTTATSYAVIGAFTFITAYFFLLLVGMFVQQSTQFMSMNAPQMLERMNFNDMVISPLFQNVQVFFLFFIPIVTMRLIAEEKRTRTMQLLMTTPVRPVEIVLGKFAAAATLTFVMLAITLIFPVILAVFGAGDADKSPIDWASTATAALGMFFMGMAAVSICLFASSVTDSQIVSAILSFALLLVFWMLGWAGQGKEGVLADVAGYMSLLNHLEGFARGLIRVQDIIFYISFSALGLFATHRMVESERWR